MMGDTNVTTTADTLEVMLQQETVYHQHNKNGNSISPAASSNNNIINRLVICLENIQELCRLRHRETLVIATSYICRYHHLNDCSDTNLERVALICLYMACKIHEPAALPLTSLTDLYQRFFNTIVNDAPTASSYWERLELKVCAILQWRLNPPTSMGFVDQFLLHHGQSISNSSSSNRRLRKKVQACLDDAFRTDPYAFCSKYLPSSLAAAALKITMNVIPCSSLPSAFLTVSSEDLHHSVAFLRRVNTATTFTAAIATSFSNNRKTRPSNSTKRCVTPPPPAEQQEFERQPPRKKLKRYSHPAPPQPSSSLPGTTHGNLSPCLISTRTSSCWQQQLPPSIPCLLWVGGGGATGASPRYALLSMAE